MKPYNNYLSRFSKSINNKLINNKSINNPVNSRTTCLNGKPLKRLLAGVLCLAVAGSIQAGGGEPYSPFYVDRGFNILPQALTKQRAYKRKTFYPGTYSAEEYDEFDAKQTFNVQAWSEFLQRSPADSRAIVYQGKFADTLEPETRAYLAAAREQEPLVTQPKKDPLPYNAQIEKLQATLKQTDDGFLRQRYVYLILRLAHYSKQYAKVTELYAQYAAERSQPNAEMALWIDALHAGALQRSGKRAEAAYQFANIFHNSQTRRLEAQLNFVIKTDAEWQALLALCKDDNEKALMHYLRGLKSKANSLAELKTIYQLAPNSPWVDEALIRELEFVQFSKGFKPMPRGRWWQAVVTVETERLIADNQIAGDKPELVAQARQRRTAYLAELSAFVATMSAEEKRNDLFLSNFAALYLQLLQQQPLTVAGVQAFQAQYKDQPRTAATKVLEYFVYLENLDAVTPEAENVISTYLQQIMPFYRVPGEYGPDRADFKQNILDYTYIKLEPLYLKQKAGWQPAKTYAAKNRGEVVLDNMLVVELRDFKQLLRQDNSEQHLLLQNMLKEMRQTATNYSLDEAIAKKYLAADMPNKALAALAKTTQPASQAWRTDYNPFNTALSGNNRKRTGSTKTLREVAETLLTLNKQIETNPKDARAYYLLGTLHYNMSWFGNSPLLLRYYRQTTNWADGEIDLQKAKDYYQLALKHSDNRNLTAKVLYALAKIEKVELYTLGVAKDAADYGRVHKPGFGTNAYQDYVAEQKKRGFAGEYFGQLRGYEDTAYFRDVISQCADYSYFHSR